jgi:hypothetical protein
MSGERSPSTPSLAQRVEWTTGFPTATDKAVLKALARWFAWRPDGTNVRPSSLAALAAKSGVPKRSVDRSLRRLIDYGFLFVRKRRHRGTATYDMNLAMLATEDPDALHATVARKNEFARQSGAQSGAQEVSGAQENRPDFDEVARTYRSDRSEVQIPTADLDLARQSGAQRHPDVEPFLAWWRVNYPLHNRGVLPPADVGAAAVVQDVLDGRTLERLQAMALAMFAIEADADPESHRSWIAKGDRSLRVLRRKAAFLERLVLMPEQLTFGPLEERPLTAHEIAEAKEIRARVYGGWCPHEPKCTGEGAYRECVRQIAWARRVS